MKVQITVNFRAFDINTRYGRANLMQQNLKLIMAQQNLKLVIVYKRGDSGWGAMFYVWSETLPKKLLPHKLGL